MQNSPIEEIKNRLDVVEIIGGYLKLNKAGANYRAICPFHSEKGPSFFISPTRQIWHCFGCGAGGDIFKFVMQIEGVEFGDALRVLAQKAGVELKPLPREAVIWQSEKQRLYEINELAAKFFEKQLESSEMGKEAEKYLLNRKISPDSIKKWRLGYSPDAWQGLFDFLTTKGYKKEEVEKTGLAIKSDKGSFYDRFRGRIMFPVFDSNSQVVGFGGRVFKDMDNKEISKYMNTPNTPLYDKSQVLYGLNFAKVAIRKQNYITLMEGYVDAIMAHQEGFENTVAVSGTALTSYQLKILKRYTENLYLSFDMDIGGDSATKRGIEIAQAAGFNIKVVTMTQGKDPADILCENPKEWEAAIAGAKTILNFYFENAFSRFDGKTSEGKREISKVLLPVIKRMPNQIERGHWTGELSKRMGAREEDVISELEKVKLEENVYGIEKEEILNLPPKSRKEMIEERLVISLLNSGDAFSQEISEEDLSFLSPKICKIVSEIKNNKKVDSKFLPQDEADLCNRLCLQAEVESSFSKEDIKEDLDSCLNTIRRLELKDRLDKISHSLREAEYEKDPEKINKLRDEFNKLAQRLNTV
jgi:DNA primase